MTIRGMDKALRIAVVGLTPTTEIIRRMCYEKEHLNMEFVAAWAPNYRDAVIASTQIVRSKQRHIKGEGVDYPHLEMGLRKELEAAIEPADAIFITYPYSTVEKIVKRVFASGKPFQLEQRGGGWVRFDPKSKGNGIRQYFEFQDRERAKKAVNRGPKGRPPKGAPKRRG